MAPFHLPWPTFGAILVLIGTIVPGPGLGRVGPVA